MKTMQRLSNSAMIPISPNLKGPLGPILLAALLLLLQGCALVHQRDREFLSDPILQKQADPLESRIESHDFPRREGSVGGSAGSGGGCGC